MTPKLIFDPVAVPLIEPRGTQLGAIEIEPVTLLPDCWNSTVNSPLDPFVSLTYVPFHEPEMLDPADNVGALGADVDGAAVNGVFCWGAEFRGAPKDELDPDVVDPELLEHAGSATMTASAPATIATRDPTPLTAQPVADERHVPMISPKPERCRSPTRHLDRAFAHRRAQRC